MELRGYKVYTDILREQSHFSKNIAPLKGSFTEVLQGQMKQGFQDTKNLLQTAEQSMMKAASGVSIDPMTVVHDVSQAELQFEMAATLRDKLIQAYQDIIRMPL